MSNSGQKIIVEDSDVFNMFLHECQDHLEHMEEKVLSLESEQDLSIVDDIFRSIHTMKGTSSYFGFEGVKELSHILETLLDQLRTGELVADAAIVDVLLNGIDILAVTIDRIGKSADGLESKDKEFSVVEPDIDVEALKDKIESVTADPKEDENPENLVTDEIVVKFIEEAKDLLDAAEKDILDLEGNPVDSSLIDGPFRLIHTIKGNAGFVGLAEIEKSCMDLESIFDSVRRQEATASTSTVTSILTGFDSLRRQINTLVKSKEHTSEKNSNDTADGQYRPLGQILIDEGETTQAVIDQALENQERKLGEILVAEGKVTEDAISGALDVQSRTEKQATRGISAERKDIRVDMAKLDKLFDLMGELITAESMVIQNPEIQDLEIESFSRASTYLTKITREMQEITMSVRMIPLEGLFNKMRRLVRDLSKRFGKKINFSIYGQDTEMDRNVIEEISDPLVHIIRNAIDHGIEDEKIRSDSGKNGTGTLELGAKYEGNEIWITVKDDGAGLSREKILNKALDRNLISGNEELRDEEVWDLILEPGFSTAAKVSEISGRGVGMDVVKKNIEKLRGKIDIRSREGEGTEIILKIPLTLAIIEGITVRVGEFLYAMPLGDILEFHKADRSQITKADADREVLSLRDEILPVIKMHEFFNGENGVDATDGILIVVQANGRKATMLVDEIAGYQQIVVKGLPEYLGRMRAISGCSILGDGQVSLIIDVGSILKESLN
ncbi:MAG: chemotaxis protein CheA [Spirochaetales bacterium]|nr:chemotaxis protein CheA [Spirochaetales bacterium]